MTLTASCTDEVGNVGTASFTVKVDKTAPTVALQAPADGATYAIGQSVAAAYSCTDNQGGSGVAFCTGPVDPGTAIDTTTPGQQTFTVDAGDLADNTATATATYNVAGLPRAALGSPFDGAQYTQGQTVTASYLCAEGVDGPGISSCTGTVPNGQQIDTSTVGVHEFTVTATSIDGLHSTSTATYTVVASPGGSPGGGRIGRFGRIGRIGRAAEQSLHRVARPGEAQREHQFPDQGPGARKHRGARDGVAWQARCHRGRAAISASPIHLRARTPRRHQGRDGANHPQAQRARQAAPAPAQPAQIQADAAAVGHLYADLGHIPHSGLEGFAPPQNSIGRVRRRHRTRPRDER